MPYPGQVFEDPDYYDEDDLDAEWEAQQHAKELEDFDPFETINS